MAFTFPLNPAANQIAVTPLGQRYKYLGGEWRTIGPAKGVSETAGVTIAATTFYVGNPVNLLFSTVADLPSSGVNPPFTFNLSSGQLPTGLIINSGTVSGTPTIADENYSFMISVTDSLGGLANTIIFNGKVSGIVTTEYVEALIEADIAAAMLVSFSNTGATGPASNASVATETTARVTEDAALSQRISTLSSSFDSTNASLVVEQNTRADAVSALSDQITILKASVNNTGPTGPATNASLIVEQTARATADAALAEQITSLVATYNGTGPTGAVTRAELTTEQTARASADSALSQQITTLTASFNDTGPNGPASNASLTTEQEARTTADASLSQQITTLAAAFNSGTGPTGSVTSAALTVESQARADADTALSLQITALNASFSNTGPTGPVTNATFSAEQTARATAEGAITTDITNLKASFSNTGPTGPVTNATFSAEQTARATAEGAITTDITNLKASFSNTGPTGPATNASVTAEATARTTADSALSQQITTLTTNTNNSVASLTQSLQTTSDKLGNATAAYTVNVDANGNVAGIQLISAGKTGSATSAFNVRADQFNVTLPGYSATPVFSVAQVNGVPTISIIGNILQNGVASLTNTYPPQTTWYVDFQHGSDTTGDGKTAGTAWATLQHAVDTVSAGYVYSGTITIKCADGTYTVAAGGTALLIYPSNIGKWYILGNTTSPSSCVINASATGSRGFGAIEPDVTIAGFQISAYYEAVYSDNHSNLYVANMNIIGTGSQSYAFAAYNASYLNFYEIGANGNPNGPGINISGSFQNVIIIAEGSLCQIGWNDITTSSPCSFNFSGVSASSVAAAVRFGTINVDATYATITGSATGSRYYVDQARISTSGAGENFFPGSSAGINVNNGIYS